MSMFVCLSVCLSAGITLKTRGRTSTNFDACWLWLLLGRRPITALRYAISTSGLLDAVMFHTMGLMARIKRMTL